MYRRGPCNQQMILMFSLRSRVPTSNICELGNWGLQPVQRWSMCYFGMSWPQTASSCLPVVLPFFKTQRPSPPGAIAPKRNAASTRALPRWYSGSGRWAKRPIFLGPALEGRSPTRTWSKAWGFPLFPKSPLVMLDDLDGGFRWIHQWKNNTYKTVSSKARMRMDETVSPMGQTSLCLGHRKIGRPGGYHEHGTSLLMANGFQINFQAASWCKAPNKPPKSHGQNLCKKKH